MKNILDKIIKGCLSALTFLFPLFFLPWTVLPISANKQMFAAAIVFLLILLWLLKIISSGRIIFRWNKISSAVLIFLIVLSLSALFAKSKIQSFWGMNFEPDTFFSFLLYGLGFFLFANLTEKKDVKRLIFTLILSVGILTILFLLPIIFKISLFPWSFAKTNGFNLTGSVQALAIFFGFAFIAIFSKGLLKSDSNKPKILAWLDWLLGTLLFVSILLINSQTVWLGLTISLLFVIWRRLKNQKESKESSVNLKAVVLPLIILIISLIFIFVRIPVERLTNLPVEVAPTLKESFNISQKTLGESTKNLIFGSGPATFAFDYDLHKSPAVNSGDFWNLRFNQGISSLLTLLATAGILGILALLLIILAFAYEFFKGNKARKNIEISFAAIPIFYFLISWIFYSVNFSLFFSIFLMLGLLTALTAKDKEAVFVRSPQKTFFIMLLSVFLFVGIGVGCYKIGKIYLGAIDFEKGLKAVNATEPDLDRGMTLLSKAINLDNYNDNYLRNLSQIYLLKINDVLNDQSLDKETKQKTFQSFVSGAELAINKAISLNSQNSQNWLQRAVIYENFFLLNIQKAGEMAVLYYQKAEQLIPQNPQIPFYLARVYKAMAEKSGKENENYEKLLDSAIAELDKSIGLKNNFSPAFQLKQEIENLKVIHK